MKKYLDKILKYGKIIFLICVSILIVLEFTKIKKDISFQELNSIINSLGVFKLVLLAILGIIAIIPMINYDIIFNKMINSAKGISYIVPRSITVNTFNNLIGFGGIINIGLRMQYFAEEKDKNTTMKILLKSFFFSFTGCSFLSMIGLINILSVDNSILKKYIPWLIVGILYYPVALLFSKYKDKEENLFSTVVFFKLSITSIAEWSMALLFFATIGYFLGVDIGLADIITVYIASVLVGLLSMIPGGLGSFDLMALTSFTAMGLESEKVLSWLMLFRLFYYIIPFFIGMAPLSNVGINENSFVQEKLAFLIYTFSDKFYSFKGLRNYKQKFASDWQPVYVSFSRKSWLLYTLISIFFADILAVKEHKN